MPTVGQAIRDVFRLTDSAGDPITGADAAITTVAALLGSSTTVAAPVAEETRGDGWYQVAFTPTDAGTWWLTVAYDDGTNPARTFLATYDVAAADITSASAVAAAVVAALPARQVVTVASPVATDGTATIVRGDAITITFTNSGWSIAAGNSIALSLTYAGTSTTFTGTRVSATSVSVSLAEAETLALTPGRLIYRYALRDTTADQTLATGSATVRG